MQQAFDDPLIMARLDADGRCVTGAVVSVDDRNREVKPGNVRHTSVPLIELQLTAPTRLLEGEVVRWTADKRVKGVVRSVDDETGTLAITNGMKALAESEMAAGDEVVFVGLDPWEGRDPWSPDEVPWTHRDTTSDLAGDGSADPGVGRDDDNPDMSLDELGEIPIIGAVGPDDVPGVLL